MPNFDMSSAGSSLARAFFFGGFEVEAMGTPSAGLQHLEHRGASAGSDGLGGLNRNLSSIKKSLNRILTRVSGCFFCQKD